MPKVGSVHGGKKRGGSPAQGSISDYVPSKGPAKFAKSSTGAAKNISGGSVNVASMVGKVGSDKIK